MGIIMKQTYFYVDTVSIALDRGNHISKRLVFNCF